MKIYFALSQKFFTTPPSRHKTLTCALTLCAFIVVLGTAIPAHSQDDNDSSIDINLEALEALKKKRTTPDPSPAAEDTAPTATSPAKAIMPQSLAPRMTETSGSRLQLFFRGITNEISAEDQVALNTLAEELVENPRAVDIASYAGAPGDDPQQARMVAFRRGLNVRGLFISYGLPESLIRLTVPALAQRGENPQRIDLFVATE